MMARDKILQPWTLFKENNLQEFLRGVYASI